MRGISRRWKAIIGLTGTAVLVFYLEFLSYVINSGSWALLPAHFINGRKVEPIRILVVADPQIQGEQNEHPLFGIVTRWDADRYLKRTYSLAKYHVKPHVVLFLGDLFDEGSIASKEEYDRYVSRFTTVFDLPTKKESTDTSYIFIPGDNDVGGESYEPVSREKQRWFNHSFGNYNQPALVERSSWNIQFVKYNKFFPEINSHPLRTLGDVLKEPKPTIRVIISHFSLLNYISESVQMVLGKLNPALILCAHDHVSSYYRLSYGPHNSVHTSLRKNFLSPTNINKSALPRVPTSSRGPVESDKFYQYARLNLTRASKDATVDEIDVPTSSYRMGVYEMGYGELHIYEDGTTYYTVLWSPSRFNQIFAYLGIYILMKIILTPWVIYKVAVFGWNKVRGYKRIRAKEFHSV